MRRLFALGVSAVILAALYGTLDDGALTAALGRADGLWLAASLLLLAPPLAGTAVRLWVLADGRLGFGEAVRLSLAAQSLNMVLPSKLGDVAKAWFITPADGAAAGRGGGRAGAVALVVFEKACDLLALLVWGAAGLSIGIGAGWLIGAGLSLPALWLLAAVIMGAAVCLAVLLSVPAAGRLLVRAGGRVPGKVGRAVAVVAAAWQAMRAAAWRDRRRAAAVIGLSLLIWLLHLVQIWAMTGVLAGDPALGDPAFGDAALSVLPLAVVVALAPLAILAGLLPLTFAGVGTRDAAFVLLFAGWLTPGAAAALGLLSILRYAVPALAGLPFAARYLAVARDRPAAA